MLKEQNCINKLFYPVRPLFPAHVFCSSRTAMPEFESLFLWPFLLLIALFSQHTNETLKHNNLKKHFTCFLNGRGRKMLLRPFDIYLKWVLVNTILGNTVSTIKNFSTIKTLIRAFSQFLQCLCIDLGIYNTRSLGALRTLTSRLRPFGPA